MPQSAFTAACAQNERLRGTLAAMRAEMERLQTAAQKPPTADDAAQTSPVDAEDRHSGDGAASAAMSLDGFSSLALRLDSLAHSSVGGGGAGADSEIAQLREQVAQLSAEREQQRSGALETAKSRQQDSASLGADAVARSAANGASNPMRGAHSAARAHKDASTQPDPAQSDEQQRERAAQLEAAVASARGAAAEEVGGLQARVAQLADENERLMELSSERRAQLDDLAAALPPAFVHAVLHGGGGGGGHGAWPWPVAPCTLWGGAAGGFHEAAAPCSHAAQAEPHDECAALDAVHAGAPTRSAIAEAPFESAREPCADVSGADNVPAGAKVPAAADVQGAVAESAVARARHTPVQNSQRATDSQRQRLRALTQRRSGRAAAPGELGKGAARDSGAAGLGVAMKARNWNVRNDAPSEAAQ